MKPLYESSFDELDVVFRILNELAEKGQFVVQDRDAPDGTEIDMQITLCHRRDDKNENAIVVFFEKVKNK